MVKPTRTTEVMIPAGAKVEVKKSPSGWGPEYQAVRIDAQVVDITVKVGKHAGVSIRVKDDGNLIITNYGGWYSVQQPQNVQLENGRSWNEVTE